MGPVGPERGEAAPGGIPGMAALQRAFGRESAQQRGSGPAGGAGAGRAEPRAGAGERLFQPAAAQAFLFGRAGADIGGLHVRRGAAPGRRLGSGGFGQKSIAGRQGYGKKCTHMSVTLSSVAAERR